MKPSAGSMDPALLDLRQLQHFVAVCEDRHFTRAARKLHVAQSTVSSSVRALERELGAPLLARNTRNVELTEAGRALLPEARRALAAAETARAAVDGVTGLRAGRAAIGTGKALHVDITGGLARFCAKHPDIDVSLQQGGTFELLEAVADGRLDFAPLGIAGPLPDHLQDTIAIAELRDEPMVLACRHDHELARRKSVRLGDLSGERFADFGSPWGIRTVNDRAFKEAGTRRRVVFEMNDVDELLELVATGLAVAIVPKSAGERSPNLRFVRLSAPSPTWTVGVAAPRGRPPTPAAQELFSVLLPGVDWPT